MVDHWSEVKSLFARALELEASERELWLKGQSDVPDLVVAEVLRLLAHAGPSSLFRSPLISPAPVPRPGNQALEPGDLLAGRFQILALLGRGGMGEVYRIRDLEVNQEEALKAIRPELATDPEIVNRLRSEVAAARKVRHENVCRIYEFHRVGSQPSAPTGSPTVFFTMELLQGETLDQRLARGPLSPEHGIQIARQIGQGLQAIHDVGIVHRDLKPSNVFLIGVEPSRVVIADFGLAHDAAAPVATTLTLYGPGAIVGTPAYMAPEQLRGLGASPQSDIHAFGVMLFQMLSGSLPFPGDSPLAIALRRLENNAPRLRKLAPSAPASWEAAVSACLQTDPQRRPASALEVVEILERGANGSLVSRRNLIVAGGAVISAGAATLVFRAFLPPPIAPLRGSPAEYHYKLGLEYATRRTPQDIRAALDEFSQAVTLFDRFALAWAELANQYCIAANFSLMPAREARTKAEECAHRALALDRSIAKAYGALAYTLSIDLKRWRQAEGPFRRALELDPSTAAVRARYAGFLGRAGRTTEAIAMAESAVALDPASFPINYQLAAELNRARQWDRLRELMLKLVQLHPAEVSGFLTLARANEWLGRFSEAEQALDTAARLPNHDYLDTFRITLYAAEGRLSLARPLAESIWRKFLDGGMETNVAVTVESAVRNRENVFQALEIGFQREDDNLLAVPTNPYVQWVRDDPRFEAFLRRLQF
jgi:tetratricopeptide (TPR) repeat protein